jgi:hypothetical protein
MSRHRASGYGRSGGTKQAEKIFKKRERRVKREMRRGWKQKRACCIMQRARFLFREATATYGWLASVQNKL